MSEYDFEYTPEFRKHLKKIKSDHQLLDRLEKKSEEILENPSHYKYLRNVLKGRCRVHIGNYVLVFQVVKSERIVLFREFLPHDESYKKK